MNLKESLIAAGIIAALAVGCYGLYRHAVNETARADLAKSALKQSQEARKTEQSAQQSVNTIDHQYQQKLQVLVNENENLRAQLASGTLGLRLEASCDTPAVSGNSKSTGRTVAATPRLTADAQQNYLTLRNQIAEQKAQLEGWQSYYEAIQKLNSPPGK